MNATPKVSKNYVLYLSKAPMWLAAITTFLVWLQQEDIAMALVRLGVLDAVAAENATKIVAALVLLLTALLGPSKNVESKEEDVD